MHPSLVEPSAFALRVYHYWRAQEPPDAPLLGSFFLEDLARSRSLVAGGTSTGNLRRYLGIEKPKIRKDVSADETVIAAAVATARLPLVASLGADAARRMALRYGHFAFWP